MKNKRRARKLSSGFRTHLVEFAFEIESNVMQCIKVPT